MKFKLFSMLLLVGLLSFNQGYAQGAHSVEVIQYADAAPPDSEQVTTAPNGAVVYAQSPTTVTYTPDMTVDQLKLLETTLYTALMVLLGFITPYFPGLKAIVDTRLRVAVTALVAIGLLVTYQSLNGSFEWFNIIQLLVSYLLATVGYDKLLSPFGLKTAKVNLEVKK